MVGYALYSADRLPVDLPGPPVMTAGLAKILAELAQRVAQEQKEGEAA